MARHFRTDSGTYLSYGIVGLVLVLVTVPLLYASLGNSGGTLVYALDDPYIHMSMARTFASHGVWGITPERFTSSTSSPGWVLLLAGLYAVAGADDIVPLALNILAALAALILTVRVLMRGGTFPAIPAAVTAVALFLLVPLPPLIMTGQEHILHCWLALLYAHLAAGWLARHEQHQPTLRRQIVALTVLAAVLPMVRYESLFIVAAFSLLFLLRRQWLPAFLLPAASAVSVGAGCTQWCIQGAWQIRDPVAVYDTLVGVYAVHGSGAGELRGNFNRFYPTIPLGDRK